MPEELEDSSKSETPAPAAPNSADKSTVVKRQRVEEMFMSFMSQGILPSRDPIAEKMTPEIIGQLIETSNKQNEREHVEKKIVANRGTLIAIVSVVAIIVLCWLFLAYGKGEHAALVISHIVVLAGGFLGGFGYAKARTKKEE